MAKGYDIEQVGAFLAKARQAYEGDPRAAVMTSWHVRTVGFDLVRGGYEVEAEFGHLAIVVDRASETLVGASVDGPNRLANGAAPVEVLYCVHG